MGILKNHNDPMLAKRLEVAKKKRLKRLAEEYDEYLRQKDEEEEFLGLYSWPVIFFLLKLYCHKGSNIPAFSFSTVKSFLDFLEKNFEFKLKRKEVRRRAQNFNIICMGYDVLVGHYARHTDDKKCWNSKVVNLKRKFTTKKFDTLKPAMQDGYRHYRYSIILLCQKLFE